MKITALSIPGLLLVTPRILQDDRGSFSERFRSDQLLAAGVKAEFSQDNHSRSNPGVIRGLHYQREPAQGKFVTVLRGRIWDVALDLRKGSSTFGRYCSVELNETEGQALWIPPGFAHGFCVLGETPADVYYKATGFYHAPSESGVRWNDPQLSIPWPVQKPLLSPRDLGLPFLRDTDPLP